VSISDLIAARTQMPLSLGFHIIFAEIGIAMLLLIWQSGDGAAPAMRSTSSWHGAGTKGAAIGFAFLTEAIFLRGEADCAVSISDSAGDDDPRCRGAAITLRLLAIALVGGALVLLPSLRYMVHTFKNGNGG